MKKKGFTLIELLVVIAVIGLLASIVLVSLGPARKKARDARRQSDIRQINLAMEMCYDDAACSGATGGANQYLEITVDANNRLSTTAVGTYLAIIPSDPGGGIVTDCTGGALAEMTAGKYCGLTNTGTLSEYCIFARLSSGTIVAASEKGVSTMAAEPASMSACP